MLSGGKSTARDWRWKWTREREGQPILGLRRGRNSSDVGDEQGCHSPLEAFPFNQQGDPSWSFGWDTHVLNWDYWTRLQIQTNRGQRGVLAVLWPSRCPFTLSRSFTSVTLPLSCLTSYCRREGRCVFMWFLKLGFKVEDHWHSSVSVNPPPRRIKRRCRTHFHVSSPSVSAPAPDMPRGTGMGALHLHPQLGPMISFSRTCMHAIVLEAADVCPVIFPSNLEWTFLRSLWFLKSHS